MSSGSVALNYAELTTHNSSLTTCKLSLLNDKPAETDQSAGRIEIREKGVFGIGVEPYCGAGSRCLAGFQVGTISALPRLALPHVLRHSLRTVHRRCGARQDTLSVFGREVGTVHRRLHSCACVLPIHHRFITPEESNEAYKRYNVLQRTFHIYATKVRISEQKTKLFLFSLRARVPSDCEAGYRYE